ncbi:hypothetical protein FOL47_011319 [Perkinsus chesapeaki]|uniref:N-acetyltransferase domain-containing protein n=1 Tax=Perkinsus chesapeaki TaxID=330153 RepID=A0A7J6MMK1_PERCH|nr:hypothetical protein FOL47_011319 [Perkinsus chesapeaki]
MKHYSFNLCTIVSTFVLLATRAIEYRDYKRGDQFNNLLFNSECPGRKGIPCYVAVDTDKGPQAVIGFISMTIPKALTKTQDAAVRAHMRDPKKKGAFGYIDYVSKDASRIGDLIDCVEVSSDFRRRGIGTKLVDYSIELGRGTAGVIGMTLLVSEQDKEAVALYKKLGFLNVLSKLGYEEDLELYALYF